MLKIGITGGIASGKTVVAKIIESMGYKVFYSDAAAKQIMRNSEKMKSELVAIFGSEVYLDGELNKPFLRSLVFNDKVNREKINSVVHPLVRSAFVDFCDAHHSEKLIFNESALLFETKSSAHFNSNILITAPIEVRINRIMKRDGVSQDIAEARIESQWSDEKKLNMADHVIFNNGDRPLLVQVEQTLELLVK